MIVQTAELSAGQRAAVEEMAGRKLQETENVLLCGGTTKVANESEHQHAVLEMRRQLELLDRSERRMSIEDSVAALLGDNAL